MSGDLEIGCAKQPHFRGVRLDIDKQVGMEDFVQGSGYQLPFKAKTFDWVECIHTLEHFDDPLKLLREIRRVSKFGMEIRVPWKFFAWGCKDHKCSFTADWFRKVFPREFVTSEHHLLFGHYALVFLELVVRIEWNRKKTLS